MTESDLKKWGGVAAVIVGIIILIAVLGGCVEVGQTTGGVEVCTGDTTECGDAHDESDSSTTSTTN